MCLPCPVLFPFSYFSTSFFLSLPSVITSSLTSLSFSQLWLHYSLFYTIFLFQLMSSFAWPLKSPFNPTLFLIFSFHTFFISNLFSLYFIFSHSNSLFPVSLNQYFHPIPLFPYPLTDPSYTFLHAPVALLLLNYIMLYISPSSSPLSFCSYLPPLPSFFLFVSHVILLPSHFRSDCLGFHSSPPFCRSSIYIYVSSTDLS